MLNVAIVPAFDDNYLWVIHNETDAAVVDPGDAKPIIDYLAKHELKLSAILTTHHHADHVGGVAPLLEFLDLAGKIPVYGPAHEKIPARTVSLGEGDRVHIAALDLTLDVIDVPGHTAGHIAYYVPTHDWLFCGDTLFACGCGRLFEGTAAQMQTSLAKLRALPARTIVHCAHEYTMSNIRFAHAVEPDNAALAARAARDGARREKNIPTVPFTIADEIATNPFMRWDSPAVIAAAAAKPEYRSGVPGKSAANTAPDKVFGTIREWKNHFK
jgi:hydroxyacylglutathione hydrolase